MEIRYGFSSVPRISAQDRSKLLDPYWLLPTIVATRLSIWLRFAVRTGTNLLSVPPPAEVSINDTSLSAETDQSKSYSWPKTVRLLGVVIAMVMPLPVLAEISRSSGVTAITLSTAG